MDTPKLAACYIRVSTEDQTEYSPDAQRRALEHYAKQHNFIILSDCIYIDAGVSGRRAEKRPAFMKMIGTAKTKDRPFDVILVHKFDRFARNREDSIVYKSMLRKQCGVQVISITESIEDDRMGVIMEAMLEAMAEYYSINLGDEVRKGMTEKALRGELQTTAPYGYRAENNVLQIVPEEADIVREIFGRYVNGESMYSISRWTQDKGILTHRGNPFDNRMVQYILSNPVYIGKLRWHPKKHRDRFSYGQDDPDLLVVDAKHDAIIDEETFSVAEEILRRNVAMYGKHARPSWDRKHWLAGIVSCSSCGGRLIFTGGLYFKCGSYVHSKCRISQHVRADVLEAAILKKLQLDSVSDAITFQVVRSENNTSIQKQLENDLALIQKKINRLRDAYLNGADTADEYKAAKQALLEQSERIHTQLESYDREDVASVPTERMHHRITDVLKILMDAQATITEKYEAASAIINRCTWDKATASIEITYRLTL